MIRIKQVKIPLDTLKNEHEQLKEIILKKLKTKEDELVSFNISKRSLDARKRNTFSYVYTVDIVTNNDNKVINRIHQDDNIEYIEKPTEYNIHFNIANKKQETRPVIVGFGPAGMFIVPYYLHRNGLNPFL